MKEIININFVSNEAPNILLIADLNNFIKDGFHLKHFKFTHNIYILYHDQAHDFIYYKDLPSKHNKIVAELNKHNLHYFAVYGQSFGGFLAFYLIFHLSERVEKAFIHDYYINSHPSYNKTPNKARHITNINLQNWIIPKKSNIPILFLLFEGNYITTKEIKELNTIFSNITFITVFIYHHLIFEQTKKFKLFFKIYNGISYKKFWNKIYPLWINSKKLPLSFKLFPRKLALEIFIYICKKKGYKTKH